MNWHDIPYWLRGVITGLLFAVVVRGIIPAVYILIVFGYGLDAGSFLDNSIVFLSNPIYFMFNIIDHGVAIEVITSALFYIALFSIVALLAKSVRRR